MMNTKPNEAKMATTRAVSKLLLFYLFLARLAYISYSNLITGNYKLNAVTSSQIPHVDNRPLRHKLTFRVVASPAQSCLLKRGHVCLSSLVLHMEEDLTIHMDINPNPGPSNCLSCRYLNARSLKAFVPSSVDPSVKVCKISKLQDLVYTGIYDLVCICETWPNDTVLGSELLPGYSIFRRDRACKTGGGVLIAVKSDLRSIRRNDLQRNNTEMVVVEIFTCSKSLILYTFYRPPSSNNVDLNLLNSSLRSNSESSCVLVVGDFNIPALDWTDSSSPVNIGGNAIVDSFCDLMGDNFLFQFVHGPTILLEINLMLCCAIVFV